MSVIKTSSITLILKILSSISALILNYTIANFYSPSEAGLFFICITIILVFSQISRIGSDSHLVRLVSTERNSKLTTQIFYSILFTSILITCLVYFLANVLEIALSIEGLANTLKWIAPSIIFYSICNHFAFFGQGINKPFIFILGTNFLQVLFTILFVVIFHFLDLNSVNSLAICYLLGCICAALSLLIVLTLKFNYNFSYKFNNFFRDYCSLLKSTYPLLFSTTLQLSTVWFSQFLVASILSSSDVAVFTISQRIAMLTSFILVSINSVVSPKFARLYKQGDYCQLEKLAKASTLLGLLFVIPFIILICAIPDLILGVFGEYYANGTQVLILLSIAQVFNVATGGVGYLLQMSGHYRDLTISNLLGFLAVLVSGIILTNKYGITGAAVTSLIGVLTCNVYLFLKVKQLLGFYNITLDIRALRNIY